MSHLTSNIENQMEAEKLREMGIARAQRSFSTIFKDPNETVMRGVGLILGQALSDRDAVLLATAEALEDMNFHSDAAALRKMAESDDQ